MDLVITDVLKNISTKGLVDELKDREGVFDYAVKPYQGVNIDVNGPAIVLVVVD